MKRKIPRRMPALIGLILLGFSILSAEDQQKASETETKKIEAEMDLIRKQIELAEIEARVLEIQIERAIFRSQPESGWRRFTFNGQTYYTIPLGPLLPSNVAKDEPNMTADSTASSRESP